MLIVIVGSEVDDGPDGSLPNGSLLNGSLLDRKVLDRSLKGCRLSLNLGLWRSRCVSLVLTNVSHERVATYSIRSWLSKKSSILHSMTQIGEGLRSGRERHGRKAALLVVRLLLNLVVGQRLLSLDVGVGLFDRSLLLRPDLLLDWLRQDELRLGLFLSWLR